MLAELLPLFAVGFAAGSIGVVLGVGGGIILVPGLIFFAGLSFQGAVGASLVCVVATSVAGSIVYLRRDRVELDVAAQLQFFTVLGAVAAGLAAGVLPPEPLHVAFGALLTVTAVRMWPRGEPGHGSPRLGRADRRMASAASVGAGLISGLLGVGGGVLNVPILHLVLRLPFERAVATSVYIIGITSAAAAVVYLARGDVHVMAAGTAMLGTLLGAAGGVSVGDRLHQRTVRIAFAVLLLYVAVRMVAIAFER